MCNVVVSKNRLKTIAKLQQKKYRDSAGLFVVEGFKPLEEMVKKNISIVEVLSLKEIKNFKIEAPVYIVNESDMKKIASTDSVCEVLTVAKKQPADINNLKHLNNLILLDSVSDAGNLGTIIRSAAAFGIDGIILYGNCVDLYSSKVIRSSAGNFFKVPIIHINSTEEIEKNFKTHIKIITALSKKNNISIEECKKYEKRIIMFGSEAAGLSDELIKIAEKNIKLEMKNEVESLNLAISASIVMYLLKGI